MARLFAPLCSIIAWGTISLTAWSLWSLCRDSFKRAQAMHKIPCAGCQFFTNSHYLKCSVRPSVALSEEAIGCPDFTSQSYAGPHHSPQA